jgi:hypothetical protein
LALFTALALACTVVPTAASADSPMPGERATASQLNKPFRFRGMRWPGRRITYFNAARQYADPLRDAVSAWNQSGARIQFVPAPRRRAKLKISAASSERDAGRTGHGGVRAAERGVRSIGPPQAGASSTGAATWVVLKRGLDRHEAARVIGHVLGLDHVTGCRAMSISPTCEPEPEAWQWRCRLLERDDFRGAVKRYGGQVGDPGPALCDIYPPPTPSEPTATLGPAEEEVTVAWRTPDSALVSRRSEVSFNPRRM